jgi:DNA modification methylase
MNDMDTLQLNTITFGDSKKLAKLIPDNSVDLVFTDPVYENIDDYKWLAEESQRILKPGKALLTFYGIGYTEETYSALRIGGRKVTWNLPVYQPGQTQRIHPKVFNHWYGLLWCGGEPIKTFTDVQVSKMGTLNGDHKWRKNIAPLAKYLSAFTNPGDTVVDFFGGGGTIGVMCKLYGRDFIVIEIDEKTSTDAQKRLDKTQPPMFFDDLVQSEIDYD